MSLAARPIAMALLLAACDPLDIQLFPPREDPGDEQAVVRDAEGPPVPPAPSPEAGPMPCNARCAACEAADACDADERCHPYTGACVAPCGPGLPQCPEDDVCNAELGVCVSCVDSSSCTSGDLGVCEVMQGVCVECTSDSHCTDDPLERPRCLTGLGVCGCESDADCLSGSCEQSECEEEEESEDDN